MRSEGFPFISGGLGVGPCSSIMGLAAVIARLRPRYCVNSLPLGGAHKILTKSFVGCGFPRQ